MSDYDLVKVPEGKLEDCRKTKCPLLHEYFGQVVCGARFAQQFGNLPIAQLVQASEAGCGTARTIYEAAAEQMR